MSFQVHDIFRINHANQSLYDFIFEAKKEFITLQKERADEVINKHIDLFIEEYKEKAGIKKSCPY